MNGFFGTLPKFTSIFLTPQTCNFEIVWYNKLTNLMEVLPMAYKITSACVSCGACADACPAGAISQGDDQYMIDAAACLDCGSCCDTCPNGAIVPED